MRAAGKRVVVFLEEGGLVEYLAALGAGEIIMAPSGALHLVGIASEVVFLKGLLDKVGVKAWLSARGKYKSARETFAEPAMTEANREMTASIVADLYDQLVGAIVESRGLDAEAVKRALDRGPFRPEEAIEARLIDRTAYRDEVEKYVEGSVARYRPVELGPYLALSTHLLRGKPVLVALVEVTGHIKTGRSVPGSDGARATGSRSLSHELDALRRDRRVRAVVVRVESPGGSVLASDVIRRGLLRLREEKPLVVSMANVAASGGYFVAGLSRTPILSDDATITGSIGVLGGKFEARELYEKLGVKKEVIRLGERAAYLSDYRGFTPDEVRKLESDIEAHYRDFVQKMAESRGLSFDELDRVAQGRVWTGRQARECGLVDRRGGLLEALGEVRTQLGLRADAPLALAVSRSERRRLPVRLEWRLPEGVLPDALSLPFRLEALFRSERIFALLPFEIRFY